MLPVPIRSADIQEPLRRRLPELVVLEQMLHRLNGRADVRVEATVSHDGIEFPIYSIVLGSRDRSAPTLGVIGGVHGLERIGAQVSLAYLQNVIELLDWDREFASRLSRSRLVFMPLVNPVGTYRSSRANGNGVDLMRNSPVTAEKPAFLLGGQTMSSRLPWYRGRFGSVAEMEVESRALLSFVEREMFGASVSLAVDVHSGFGATDRLWFPYAKSREMPTHLPEIAAIKNLYDRSYPHHFYQIEPQSKVYSTHGDLWDWLYDARLAAGPGVMIPWTLELGSWIWLKKNPRQIFSSLGAFNPLEPHRHRRILRRHLGLFDFMHRALLSPDAWSSLSSAESARLRSNAHALWYAA